MPRRNITRRHVLQGLAASPLAVPMLSRPAAAAAPAPSAVTPALIEAAKKEGKVVWYTAIDLPVAERIAKAFEAKYPGIAVRVERSGAERIFQRIGQEYAQQDPRGRRASTARTPPTSSSGSARAARALRAGGRGAALSGRAQGPRRPVRQLAHLRCRVIGYNTKLVKRRGGAEELRRPARSEVGRQDGQGASRLQRHHHDRHLPDRARHRLGAISRSWRRRR